MQSLINANRGYAMLQMMYESMKVRVEHVVERGKVGEEFIDGDRERRALSKWTDDFTRQNHPAVIEVFNLQP